MRRGYNPYSTCAGAYEGDSGNFVAHSFVRTSDATITTFEAPGAGTGSYQGTGFNQIAGLNCRGQVTAEFVDSNYVFHGFLRQPDGSITTFDVPLADTTDASAGTVPVSINFGGSFTGNYLDSNFVSHGFLRTP